MRALLVCAAPVEGYENLIKTEALKSDIVVAVDGGARLCRQASVVPDLAIGDFDSIDSATLGWIDAGRTNVVRYPALKDETDLDLALQAARRSGATQIAVCAATSGRLDHTLAAIGSLVAAADLCPEIVESGQHGWILSASHRSGLDVGSAGETLSILALTNEVAVTARGVRWPIARQALPLLGSVSISNVVNCRSAHVEIHSGVALVLTLRPRLAAAPSP